MKRRDFISLMLVAPFTKELIHVKTTAPTNLSGIPYHVHDGFVGPWLGLVRCPLPPSPESIITNISVPEGY